MDKEFKIAEQFADAIGRGWNKHSLTRTRAANPVLGAPNLAWLLFQTPYPGEQLGMAFTKQTRDQR